MDSIKTIVYVQIDKNRIITAINSSVFLRDTEGWTVIDEGEGDRYTHAQSSYLPAGLTDENGLYNYKLINGKPEMRTDEDKTPERKKQAVEQEIAELKSNLATTDYIGIKIGEGAATSDEYADELADRASWRAKINELENMA